MLMTRSFTVKSEGVLLKYLATPCHVSQAFDPADRVSGCAKTPFDAQWDTGASKSVITQRVVDACGLKPIRRGYTHGVNGLGKSEAYVVNIYLPSQITIHELTVVRTNPGDVWWDVLIGMDVISAGEFSVKKVNSNTEWSFSITPAKADS
jgi:hypothetical protein